jgi:cobyric acid synthase
MHLLGTSIDDPLESESGGLIPRLGLLDIATELVEEKTPPRCLSLFETNETTHGYDIHHGQTNPARRAAAELDNSLG